MSSSHSSFEEEVEFILKPIPRHNEKVSFKIRILSYIPNEQLGTCHGESIIDKGPKPRDLPTLHLQTFI